MFPFNQQWLIAIYSQSPERFARGGRPKVTDLLEVDEVVSLGGSWRSSWDEERGMGFLPLGVWDRTPC